MPILENIVNDVIKQIATKAWQKLSGKERIVQIVKKYDLTPNPSPDFDSVYIHTLVEFGAYKAGPILELFRHPAIQNAFRESFMKNNFTILESEAEALIEWNKIGDELHHPYIDLRKEFGVFTSHFLEMIRRTKTPSEIQRDHIIEEIHKTVKNLESLSLPEIREKNRELIPAAAKHPYKVFVSGTFLDNEKRRENVQDAITTAGMVWHGMEIFAAATRPTVEECIRQVKESDLLIGIIAWRYGWEPDGYEKSITELEYNASTERLMFQLDPNLLVNPVKDYDSGPYKWDKQKKLDTFKERFAKDQLPAYFNDSTLQAKVLHSLNKWREAKEPKPEPKPPKPPQPVDPALGDDIISYYQKAESLHEVLPVAGFVTQLKVPIDIEEIYVPLNAMVDLKGFSDKKPFSNSREAEKRLGDQNINISLPEALRQSEQRGRKGTVILGDPGSGKTTHLKRLLLYCIRNGSETVGLPEKMAPVFLPLRDLDSLNSGLDSFIQKQLSHPDLQTPKDFGKRLLKRGNLLLLFDGLDEVADLPTREKVAEWITASVRNLPTCRFVVTCRFAGYSPQVRMNQDFLETHIRPMTADQAARFIHNWYGIVEKGIAKDLNQAEGIARVKAEKLITRLKDSDFRASRVFELTRNPLLLTNICLVHRHRGDLPRKRARLYKECIDVLLEHWRDAIGLKVIPAEEGRRALQPAAYWLHKEDSRTKATADELIPHIEPVLNLLDWKGGTAKDFLNAVRDVSGLLTGWDQDNYGFMHLGFQEYLTAREIRTRAFKDKSVLRELASHFGESWWQEVSLLLLALEDPSLFEPYMREVVKLPAFVKYPDLVAACLDDAAERSLVPFEELVKRPAGTDTGLWERQFVALKILERLAPKTVEELKSELSVHPSQDIVQWIRTRFESEPQDILVTERGGYELVRIPGGEYMMGSPEKEEGRYEDEGPLHKVRVPDFYIGKYPVTNEEYGRFLRENPNVSEPEYWADRQYNQPRQPVVGVSWNDAKQYAEWTGLRLPSEAEWEFACRGGTKTRYYTGDTEKDLDKAGWYEKNSEGKLHPVGEKEANRFGLYDMHGNVDEWVEDDWHGNYDKAPNDGRAWVDKERGSRRVVRGGGWGYDARYCRSAFRGGGAPGVRHGGLGFRLSMSVSLDP